MWIAPPDADIDSMDADADLPDGDMSAAGSGRVDHGDEPFPTIVQAAGLGLGLVGVDGSFRYVNPRLAELLGRPGATLVGNSVLDLLDEAGRQTMLAAAARRRAAVSDTYRLDYARPDGELLHLEVLSTPVRAADGTVTARVVVIRDDSDRVRIEAELTRQALTDPLTGLPNRATLRDRLTQALARAARHPGLLAVLFVDLDRFKQVNDAFGHAAGDSVLRISAARMTRAVRPGDTVGRFGGDEFVVLCEDVPDVDEAARIAERLHAALNPPVRVADNDVTVTASIGVAVTAVTAGTAGTGTVEPDQLLHRADLAMYRAKAHGRARYHILGVDTATNSAPSSARLLADLRAALAAGDLVVHYQPRIDLRSGHPVGAEALLRWQHRTRGLLPPAAFLDLADRSGLSLQLGTHVLYTACTDASRWPTPPGQAPPTLSVNISAHELGHPQLIDRVARTLADTGLAPGRLILELTETTLLGDVDTNAHRLTDLHTLGIGLAVDDFGTGYSSLAYLPRFPVDELKIDTSVVAALPAAHAVAIVTGIVSVAHSSSLRVVAEGVQTPAQRDLLTALGADYAQGHLWSPALAAADLPAVWHRDDRDE